MNTNTKRASKGFTLLEILLVIAAIGILAAIVLVAVNPNRQLAQARNAQRRADINTIYKAIEQYLIDTGSYPSGITTTLKDICINGNTTNCVDLGVIVPDYLAGIPVEPAGGAYRVSINEENNRIRVRASNAEQGQIIVVNPALEERIQAQIIAGTIVVTGTQTLVEGRLVYTNNAGTQTYIDRPSTTISCPTGYIAVPGNSMYGTNDFCVMKYEAKAVATSDPTVGLLTPTTGLNTIANNTTATTAANGRAIASVASGYPIANINQTTAASYCTTAGASLITNAEWMTIARNIEGQGANWTGGTVGSGGLWRGHSDNSPGSALEASTDDNLGYTGTGNTSPSIERRTHTLSNGETIWDLSGNVWEWTSDTILGQDKPNSSSGNIWQQWTAISNFGTLSYDLTRPSNPAWNSSQNMGQYYAGGVTGTTTFAFLRGGHWNFTSSTGVGVFTLFLGYTPSYTSAVLGFRCVLR
jgi:prepilin-type N-terminal cleavage/methylation domain-containing protein